MKKASKNIQAKKVKPTIKKEKKRKSEKADQLSVIQGNEKGNKKDDVTVPLVTGRKNNQTVFNGDLSVRAKESLITQKLEDSFFSEKSSSSGNRGVDDDDASSFDPDTKKIRLPPKIS